MSLILFEGKKKKISRKFEREICALYLRHYSVLKKIFLFISPRMMILGSFVKNIT